MLRLLLISFLLITRTLAYDPSTPGPRGSIVRVEVTYTTPMDGKRVVSLLVYLPSATEPAPIVLFSHGLGGTKEGSAFLGTHWASRGYVAVFLQHPGSDDSAWKDVPPSRRMQALQAAASIKNFLARTQDVPAVLDQLALWHKQTSHPLAGRLDLNRIGMSGHSFGAITTQALSGQSSGEGARTFTDSRIKAAIAMSPMPPKRGEPADVFSKVKIPWFLMTGSKDFSIVADATPETRAVIFKALPPGSKYELILHNAEHSAFTERPLPGDRERRNPNHHRAILALSTAFWDAYLREDPKARAWLDGTDARTVLENEDELERK